MTKSQITDYSLKRSSIANRLRHTRIQSGMQGQQLCRQLGIRPGTLSKMEHGDQVIPAELLGDWCLALDVSVSSIIFPEVTDRALEEETQFYMQILSELNEDHRTLVLKHLEMVYNHEKEEDRRRRKK